MNVNKWAFFICIMSQYLWGIYDDSEWFFSPKHPLQAVFLIIWERGKKSLSLRIDNTFYFMKDINCMQFKAGNITMMRGDFHFVFFCACILSLNASSWKRSTAIIIILPSKTLCFASSVDVQTLCFCFICRRSSFSSPRYVIDPNQKGA